MNALKGTLIGLMFVMSGSACSAQNAAIPFRQIERDAQLSASLEVPNNAVAIINAEGMLGESSSSSSFVLPPIEAPKPPRTLSPGFFALNGIHLGLAILDIEMTQHCIADNHCREGNPLMPSSHAGQLGVNFAIVGYGTFVSYRLKKNERKLWVLSPIVGIVAHSLGVASGIAHY
jgi:hypothetical protein